MGNNDETNNSSELSYDKSSDTTPQPEFDSSSDIASDQNNGNDTEEHTRKVKYWREYREKWKDPLVIVTIILAVATFMLYWRATRDSKTAERAADYAEKAVTEQKTNDSTNRIEQRSKDSTDGITREITFASIKSSDSISKATLQS